MKVWGAGPGKPKQSRSAIWFRNGLRAVIVLALVGYLVVANMGDYYKHKNDVWSEVLRMFHGNEAERNYAPTAYENASKNN